MANENPNRQPAGNPGKGPNEEFPGKAPDVYAQKHANKANKQQQGQNEKPETQPQQGGQGRNPNPGGNPERQKQPDDTTDPAQHNDPNRKNAD